MEKMDNTELSAELLKSIYEALTIYASLAEWMTPFIPKEHQDEFLKRLLSVAEATDNAVFYTNEIKRYREENL